jgi:hypothetical protein
MSWKTRYYQLLDSLQRQRGRRAGGLRERAGRQPRSSQPAAPRPGPAPARTPAPRPAARTRRVRRPRVRVRVPARTR